MQASLMHRLARLALLMASIFVCVALAEFGLRLVPGVAPPPVEWIFCEGPERRTQFHPEFGWVEIPGSRYFERRSADDGWAHFEHNADGFRDNFDRGDRHAIVLGDSFARGTLVAEDESVEGLLDRWYAEVAFHGYGLGGYGTREQYAVYREMSKRFEHELVVLLYFLGNDLSDNGDTAPRRPHFRRSPAGAIERFPGTPAVPRAAPPSVRSRVAAWLRDHSRLSAFATSRLRLRWSRFDSSADVNSALGMTRLMFDGIADTAESRGAALLIVMVPADDEVEATPPPLSSRQRELLDSFASGRSSVAVLDLAPLLRIAGSSEHYGRVDKHFNARGQHLTARAIHDWIEAQGPATLRSGAPAPAFSGPSAGHGVEPNCALSPPATR